MRIDSHHHFWNYTPDEYSWIDEAKSILRRDYGPEDLKPAIEKAKIDRVISVQARQSLAETQWLIELAKQHGFVAGVVGWVPLAKDSVRADLESLSSERLLKAVRHVVQDEPDDGFILGADFNRGVGMLKEFELVYDILIFAKHLAATTEFVDRHPDQAFVVDHIAKPTIDRRQLDQGWASQIQQLARRPNVACKFSGVATEVIDAHWDHELLRPYWDVALAAFGPDRILFGSDWPVCRLRTEYGRWVETVERFTDELTSAERDAIWGANANRIYSLSLV